MAFLIALVIVVVLAAIYGFVLHNALVSLRRQSDLAFGQIELQLKRRCDAIPGLVAHVKSELHSDHATLQKLVKAREEALSAKTVIGKAAAENHLHRAIEDLILLARTNPVLELDDELLTLQENFRTSQNKIAFASQYYNDAATAYNERLEAFPSSLIASMRKFTPISHFEFESVPVREPARV